MSAVVAGQELLFRNADSQSHRVQLVTTNNSRFTHDLAAKSEMTSPALMKPESFLPIKCEKHPWELAYVFVVEHPFFAVSDTNGNFVIPNVPPGRYTLRASHLFAGGTNTIARGVKVTGGQISQVNFTFDAPTH
jgi:hypothetical protein